MLQGNYERSVNSCQVHHQRTMVLARHDDLLCHRRPFASNAEEDGSGASAEERLVHKVPLHPRLGAVREVIDPL
eukprot:756064-Hanusia_phi.AAC.4